MLNSFQKNRNEHTGFTLVELMTTLLVLSVLLAIGIPSFNGYLDRNRLKSAAEGIFFDLQYARSEAILRGPNGQINVSFSGNGTGNWCYGLTTATSCDCTKTDSTDAAACILTTTGASGTEVVLKRTSGDTYLNNVLMATPVATIVDSRPTIGFSALRGLSSQSQIELQSADNTIRIIVSPLGQIRICSPTESITGFSAC